MPTQVQDSCASIICTSVTFAPFLVPLHIPPNSPLHTTDKPVAPRNSPPPPRRKLVTVRAGVSVPSAPPALSAESIRPRSI